jgi:hypothetical protein
MGVVISRLSKQGFSNVENNTLEQKKDKSLYG